MYIARGILNLPPRFRGGAVTIGNFDGVHLGHQALFSTLSELAREATLPVVAVTFEPHPRRLLHPADAPPRVTGVRGKARFMVEHGVEAMLVMQFTRELAALTPVDFVRKVLVEGLAARRVVVGYDFRFGRQGAGRVETLAALGRENGFDVRQEPPFLLDGEPVSSTRIRQKVLTCDFAGAEALLGRPFEIEARVGPGKKLGRNMGFPTANLPLTDMLHPPAGVYVVEGLVEETWLPGVANVGHNPTFGEESLHMETHLLAPCGDLYRKVMRVRFHRRVREERRFPDAAALKEQIQRDVEEAYAFFQNRS